MRFTLTINGWIFQTTIFSKNQGEEQIILNDTRACTVQYIIIIDYAVDIIFFKHQYVSNLSHHSCTLCGVGQKLPISNDGAICDKAAASAHCKCIKVNHHIFTALGRLCTSAMVRNFIVWHPSLADRWSDQQWSASEQGLQHLSHPCCLIVAPLCPWHLVTDQFFPNLRILSHPFSGCSSFETHNFLEWSTKTMFVIVSAVALITQILASASTTVCWLVGCKLDKIAS